MRCPENSFLPLPRAFKFFPAPFCTILWAWTVGATDDVLFMAERSTSIHSPCFDQLWTSAASAALSDNNRAHLWAQTTNKNKDTLGDTQRPLSKMTVVASLCEPTNSPAIDFWAGLQWPRMISPLQSKPQIQCGSNSFYEIYIRFLSQSRGKVHSAGWMRSWEWLVPPSDRARSISTESGLNIQEDTGAIQGLSIIQV